MHYKGYKKYTFLDENETITNVIDKNQSIIRWGDGETNILLGKSIYFQKYNHRLRLMLRDTLFSDEKNILICIPVDYLKCSIFQLIRQKKLRVWAYTRYVLHSYLRKSRTYGDAFIFRTKSKLNKEQISLLWDNKSVILVGSSREKYIDFSRQQKLKCEFVQIDESNAFNKYQETLEKIIEISKNYSNQELRVLISAGPMAKILVHQLSLLGFVSYDIGQYLNWKFYDVLSEKGI